MTSLQLFPVSSMEHVLSYPSLKNVKSKLQSIVFFQLVPISQIVTGYDLVRFILSDYDPNRSIEETEFRLSEVFNTIAGLVPITTDVDDLRTYLINVAHMLWLESNVGHPVTLIPSAIHTTARVQWSLYNLSATQIDEYLLGILHHNERPGPGDKPGIQYHHHFKFYKIAINIMTRMKPFFSHIENDFSVAVPRIIEYVKDNFLHTSPGWSNGLYKGALFNDTYVYDKDLSEIYQRRVGGCGVASFVSVLLARSINIPAAVDHPILSDGSMDGHRYSYFPTIDRWVHGDAVALAPQRMGCNGEKLLWSTSFIKSKTYAQIWSIEIEQAVKNAETSSVSQYGVGFSTFNRQNTRSFTSTYFLIYNSSLLPLVKARCEYFLPRIDTTLNKGIIDAQKYLLLDRVAAHWNLDGNWIDKRVVKDSSLNQIFGKIEGSGILVTNNDGVSKIGFTQKRAALNFVNGSLQDRIAIRDDHPQLRRNNKELSISVWLKRPSNIQAGVILGRYISPSVNPLFAKKLLSPGTQPYNFAYVLAINSLNQIIFEYQRESDGKNYGIASKSALTNGHWHHIVITYDANDKLGIYINGVLDTSVKSEGDLPMAFTEDISSFPWVTWKPYPAITIIGWKFIGLINMLTLYFSALTANEVRELYSSFVS